MENKIGMFNFFYLDLMGFLEWLVHFITMSKNKIDKTIFLWTNVDNIYRQPSYLIATALYINIIH